MPTLEQLKHFVLTVILPQLVAVAATWIVSTVHVLNLFGITEGQVAGELSLLGTYAITVLVTFLAQHHILSGHYTPAAKSLAVRQGVVTHELKGTSLGTMSSGVVQGAKEARK